MKALKENVTKGKLVNYWPHDIKFNFIFTSLAEKRNLITFSNFFQLLDLTSSTPQTWLTSWYLSTSSYLFHFVVLFWR